MTEPPGAGTEQRPSLGVGVKLLLLAVAVLGIAAWAGMGWQETGMIVLALLLLSWPALAFYAWAKRRGDL